MSVGEVQVSLQQAAWVWSQISGFTKFGGGEGGGEFPLHSLLEAPDLSLKRANSTSMSAVMSSSFAVSHFSLTMSHCEHAAFSLIIKTLKKHDCSEVKGTLLQRLNFSCA